ncbi:MAG: Na/Pi cotransporter family protein [Mogibacterium sp.]|nr:Na/Pi cotransporter family protein [Mogibacterium sp.]
MGDGLSMVAGNKLEVVLYRLTSNPIKGILLGIGVTALIQSSTATSVMVIGFVNSGMMSFYQAVGVILGSIVGTSVTGWIVSLTSLGQGEGLAAILSPTFITGVMAIAGIILIKFSKNATHNRVGTILLGFSVLMFGMNSMSEAVSPLRESESFISAMTAFSNPLLGILVGVVFTAIIQSSAAAVGILQALSMTGALSFATAFPIILGIAVGGALPVLISAIGASVNARRTALVHLIIDIFGAAFCGIVFYAINAIHPFGFVDARLNPVTVALVNTLFRVVTVVVLTPCIRLLEKIACAIIKDEPEPEIEGDWVLLEDRFVPHPALAIEQCRIVLNSMATLVRENLLEAFKLLDHYSEEGFQAVADIEEQVDRYEDKLGTYIVKVTSGELTQKQNEDIYQFLHAITDLERISDHANNIAENAKEIYDKKIEQVEEVRNERHVMESALTEVFGLAYRALLEGDGEAASRVEPLEELIDNLCDEIKYRQIERIRGGVYSRQNSFVFNDLLTNYERISDHCSNIAIAMIELKQDEFDLHNYVESLKQHKNELFDQYFDEYRLKYSL